MLYSRQIPELLSEQNPYLAGLVKVLDGLEAYKQAQLLKSSRFYNPVLLTNRDFLRKLAEELGWPSVPFDFPKEILDNMILNAERIWALKGSNLGFEILLRALTCGEPTVTSSAFFPETDFIILDELNQGYLPDSEMISAGEQLYLFEDFTQFQSGTLSVSVATPYEGLESLKTYIQTNLPRFVGFIDEDTTITITYSLGPHVPNPHAFSFFR